MDLLKVSISKDARIAREVLWERIADDKRALNTRLCDHVPDVRNTNDSIRAALTYHCRSWKQQESAGAECRVVSKASDGAKGLNLRIRIERLPDDAEQEIASVVGGANGKPVTITMTPEGRRAFPELWRLVDVQALTEFGETHLFESDLRRLCKSALESACMPLWPGLSLVLTADGHEMVNALQTILEALDTGTVTLRSLSLDNTPANREALARELGEGMRTQLAKLHECTQYTAPNTGAIRAEYAALEAKIVLIEEVLGIELGCLDAQVALEMALETV